MSYLIVILITLLITAPISYFWVKGIDYMHKNHPDYKGDDLFGEFDENDKNQMLCKVKTLEYRIYRKLREKLKKT